MLGQQKSELRNLRSFVLIHAKCRVLISFSSMIVEVIAGKLVITSPFLWLHGMTTRIST